MIMNNKVYDVLKWVAILFLPALATLIGRIFSTWGLPNGTEIARTINDIGFFLGVILGISNMNYYKEEDK